jgi:hypothetical protein
MTEIDLILAFLTCSKIQQGSAPIIFLASPSEGVGRVGITTSGDGLTTASACEICACARLTQN